MGKMGGDRRSYVMSVELAMQREMAYRQKLEKLKDPMSHQGSTTIFGPAPRAIPRPNHTPFPHPTLGFFPNLRPNPFFGRLPGQVLPPPGPNVWYRGPSPVPMHLMRPTFPAHSPGQKRKQPLQAGAFFCDLCQVDCSSAFHLGMHFNGKKHKANLDGANDVRPIKVVTGTVPKERPYCGLCRIWCPDETSFWQHLNGRNHMGKLQASEQKKLKGPAC